MECGGTPVPRPQSLISGSTVDNLITPLRKELNFTMVELKIRSYLSTAEMMCRRKEECTQRVKQTNICK